MPKTLYNILVPVDFTSKNKWAISKAIELANTFHCNVHLVHVSNGGLMPLMPLDMSMMMPSYDSADLTNARKKLENLRNVYRNHLCGGGNIEISLLRGNPSQQLADYIEKFQMDMVVVGLARFNLLHRILSTVSISRLARKTNVPVLAIRSSGLVSHFKKIVLPLTDNLPLHRIKLATMLARSFKSTVYLVSLKDESNKHNTANGLMDTALEVIQSLSTIPVQCFILEGKNLAKSTLEFSKRINADLIMANPLKEFHMPGWWNRITRKILSYGSRIPVITDSRSETKSAF
ncbi:universal stress protein [Pseudoflavitalea sp. G-6-1-2]|uniref:universal stress protein n=1 Tax=Pseudoflavitalea sp. G-6-1-2 TaxID=2728841 RepID=UPI00146C9185|nr:universal stress protein [Pseudoflavitalea sp. G-6-1-2]NML22649.1 universal stress protein [Pseudoflavitalea sp. G-6-1-2]